MHRKMNIFFKVAHVLRSSLKSKKLLQNRKVAQKLPSNLWTGLIRFNRRSKTKVSKCRGSVFLKFTFHNQIMKHFWIYAGRFAFWRFCKSVKLRNHFAIGRFQNAKLFRISTFFGKVSKCEMVSHFDVFLESTKCEIISFRVVSHFDVSPAKDCCVLQKFVVFCESLLCSVKFCCVLRKFVVFCKSLLCSAKVGCVLWNFVVFCERLLCFCSEIYLCFALVGHRTLSTYVLVAKYLSFFWNFASW